MSLGNAERSPPSLSPGQLLPVHCTVASAGDLLLYLG